MTSLRFASWPGVPRRTGEFDVAVKVRYRARPVTAVLAAHDADWRVDFAEPQLGVAPGQAAVFYRGDEVLGGGRITATHRAARAS